MSNIKSGYMVKKTQTGFSLSYEGKKIKEYSTFAEADKAFTWFCKQPAAPVSSYFRIKTPVKGV